MCGLAGLLRWDNTIHPEDVALVAKMSEMLKHRGPDDFELWSDSFSVLAHRRLSIIDLSRAARQPMTNEEETIRVLYNGEIYNYKELRQELIAAGHQFRSVSDSEVLVHGYEEWGMEGLLSRLRGMFAFALYDSRSNEPVLYLVRDRLGIKPLYYYPAPDRLLFASEARAIIHQLDSRTINADALLGYLLFGSIPTPMTLDRRVSSLPAAHYLVNTRNGTRIVRYWSLDLQQKRTDSDLADLLRDSMEHHLLSDVPLGLFLSGGVDSAALLCLKKSISQSSVRTITVSFPELEYSEAKEAKSIAEAYGASHEEIHLSVTDFIQDLPKILSAMDQPTHDGVNTYFVCKAAKAAGLKVVLSGLGGDEVFWGYRHYRWLSNGSALSRLLQLPYSMKARLAELLSLYGRLAGNERWLRFASMTGNVPENIIYFLIRGFYSVKQTAQLLAVDSDTVQRFLENTLANSDAGTTSAHQFNFMEFHRYLHDQLLRDTDIFSMAHSIEARVPFLDHKIVEAVFPLATGTKICSKMNKPLLVNAVGDRVLMQIASRPKKGFAIPMKEWMMQCSDDLEQVALRTDCLEKGYVRSCFRAFRRGKLHWSRAWSLVALGATEAA